VHSGLSFLSGTLNFETAYQPEEFFTMATSTFMGDLGRLQETIEQQYREELSSIERARQSAEQKRTEHLSIITQQIQLANDLNTVKVMSKQVQIWRACADELELADLRVVDLESQDNNENASSEELEVLLEKIAVYEGLREALRVKPRLLKDSETAWKDNWEGEDQIEVQEEDQRVTTL
jgi:hypothetical protein